MSDERDPGRLTDPSQPKPKRNAHERFHGALAELFRQVGRGNLTLDEAATRVLAVLAGRAPDARDPVPCPPASQTERQQRRLARRARRAAATGDAATAMRHLERILEHDPRDVRSLLKLGDLQSQQGDVPAAIDTYVKAAQFYVEQGFYLKAVAVYKQILGIDRDRHECHARLADLYHQLGLMQDAVHQYQLLAGVYERTGLMRKAITTWRKIAELEPHDIGHRIRLAEAYATHGMTTEAVEEFGHVARTLLQHRRMKGWAKVAARIIHLDPTQQDLQRDLARYRDAAQQPRTSSTDDEGARADGADIAPEEATAAWKQWAAHGPQGPIADADEDTIRALAVFFADIAQPTLDGPMSALRGLALCCEQLGERGRAIEVLDMLVTRAARDPNPPAWLADTQTRLRALQAESKP